MTQKNEDRTALLALLQREVDELGRAGASGDIVEATPISGLGLDSLKMMELIGNLEMELGIEIPDSELNGVTKIAEILDVVEARMRARTGTAG